MSQTCFLFCYLPSPIFRYDMRGQKEAAQQLLCRFFYLQSMDQISYQRISLAARSSWKLEPSPL